MVDMGILRTMINLASLSSGQQVALAVGVNIAALVMLWGPYAWFRWHYRNTKNISWRARVGLFVVFAILFTIFWWGYLALDSFLRTESLVDTLHFSDYVFIADIISFLSIPTYSTMLLYSKVKSRILLLLLIAGSSLAVSFYLHLSIYVEKGFRFIL